MKMLYVLFAVAFLVFQVQAVPTPLPEDESEGKEALMPRSYEDDDHSLTKESKPSSRMVALSCFQNQGYCLPRNYQCLSGLVFKEPFNDCLYPDLLKCCVH